MNMPLRPINTETDADFRRLLEKRDRLRRGQRLQLDDADRILSRARRLADDPDEVADLNAAERVLGTNEIVHAHFLLRGARASNAVARVVRLSTRGDIAEIMGTGCLIAPGLFVTNHHVLKTADVAARHALEFNFEYDISGRVGATTIYGLEPHRFFAADGSLDVAVTAVAADTEGSGPGDRFGYHALSTAPGELVIGDYLNIVQHPGGGLKQVSFRENRLIDESEGFLVYETDTEPGSSGSPVFNDQWVLVGVHRRSLARIDEQGRYLMKDGSVWREGMPDDRVDWYANEGVKVGAIQAWLLGLEVSAQQRDLIQTALEN